MTLNGELYYRDPTTHPIPNDGVAQVIDPQTPEQWAVLRYELESFVCEGEYHRGLELILTTFLENLKEPKQPAVWVSGFYGSGKSHLVRVLEYLWRDVEFPDGATARSLTHLPDDISDALKELTTEGKRQGGLWSAAGTLGAGAGSNVRLALLGILLRSAGLPERFATARFVLWLKQNNYYDAVRAAVEASGRVFANELNNLYVSDILAKSLLAVYPDFAESPALARQLLRENYPNREDISDSDFLVTIEEVLALQSKAVGKLPLTLLVFDELQQFLGEDQQRTLNVQNVVELCSTRFGSRVLFVATGQSALTATTQLQKLKDRFTVTVPLEDKDVQTVVRQVVLRKKPAREPELKQLLETTSGEIDRQLQGTKIAPSASDQPVLVPDYPLLPARRRFWERTLRAIDEKGTAGQLRTQLRIVHEAAAATAAQPIGTIVAGDFIFKQLQSEMLQSGILLREENLSIQELDDGTADGKLKSRLAALVFLIGKLPTQGPLATGIRPTAPLLADLLVDNLSAGSSALRQRVPELLQELADKGILLQVGDEYRLQTREGAEWDADFRARYARIHADDARVADERANEFRNAVTAALKGITFTQGVSKTPRKFELHFGADAPSVDSGNVPVWVRDEWSVSELTVRQDAQQAGSDNPIVYVLLPRRDADALRSAIAAFTAAKGTVEGRPAPTPPEVIVARTAMESRQRTERARLDGIVSNIVSNARVFQGGGNEIAEGNFRASVEKAVNAALARLYPKFDLADAPNWSTVLRRASEGAADALTVVGYNGDVDKHPVCSEIRAFIGTTWQKGSEIRRQFEGAGYGWPKDAIDACLVALTAGGFVQAQQNGQPIAAKNLTQTKIGVTDFRSEGTTISAAQRLAIRKLITDLGETVQPNQESERLPAALQKLLDLAENAGGEPPLPAKPATAFIEQLRSTSGNEQLGAAYDQRALLTSSYAEWKRRGGLIGQRKPRWEMLQRLMAHAHALPITAELKSHVEAIRAGRTLLDEPDPLTPIMDQLTGALRAQVIAARQRLAEGFKAELAALDADAEWQKLTPAQRKILLEQNNLTAPQTLDVSTDTALLSVLDRMPLSDWQDQLIALSGRVAKTREQAAKLLEPQAITVKPRPATLRTAADVDAYLDELRLEIIEHIAKGNPVII